MSWLILSHNSCSVGGISVYCVQLQTKMQLPSCYTASILFSNGNTMCAPVHQPHIALLNTLQLRFSGSIRHRPFYG